MPLRFSRNCQPVSVVAEYSKAEWFMLPIPVFAFLFAVLVAERPEVAACLMGLLGLHWLFRR